MTLGAEPKSKVNDPSHLWKSALLNIHFCHIRFVVISASVHMQARPWHMYIGGTGPSTTPSKWTVSIWKAKFWSVQPAFSPRSHRITLVLYDLHNRKTWKIRHSFRVVSIGALMLCDLRLPLFLYFCSQDAIRIVDREVDGVRNEFYHTITVSCLIINQLTCECECHDWHASYNSFPHRGVPGPVLLSRRVPHRMS